VSGERTAALRESAPLVEYVGSGHGITQASDVNDEYRSIIKQFLSGPHAEALAWLGEGGGSRRRLGEHQSTGQSVALVERLYGLGSQKVIAVELHESPDGSGAARYLLVELPEEHRGREAIFAFEREEAQRRGFEGTEDEGQVYLFLDVKGIA
jgi:hypothetical protein